MSETSVGELVGEMVRNRREVFLKTVIRQINEVFGADLKAEIDYDIDHEPRILIRSAAYGTTLFYFVIDFDVEGDEPEINVIV